MPKITVIIPTYNRANLIGETIQSVLRQTVRDFNLIVVDDGSTDNTGEVLKRYQDPRVRYEYRENRGVSVARNIGLKLSNTDYVTFLDSDDIYLDNSLEKFVNCLDSNKEIGFCYGQANIMKVGGEVYRVRKSHFYNDSTVIDPIGQIRELLFHKPYNVSTCAMRRSCVDAVGGFNEDLWFAEDMEFFIRLAKKYSAAYIAEPVANVRFHDKQLQNEIMPGKEKAFLSILQEVFEDPNIAHQIEDIKDQVYCYYYGYFIADKAYEIDMKLFRHYLRMAIKFYPKILFKTEGTFITYKYFASLLPNPMRLALRNFKRRFKYTLEDQE
jgi:glycosyltransferase involved in cell wall biosynthesis